MTLLAKSTFFLLLLFATACLTTVEKNPNPLEITQPVIFMQQTQTAMTVGQLSLQVPEASSIPDSLIPTLTAQTALLTFVTET